jgi:MtrB/PioB family decaheme-associated outer membrane protein
MMKPISWRRYLPLALGVTVFANSVAAETPDSDTSDWKCEQCPFFQTFEGDVEAGALSASGANASYGRYTGIDHGGAYADAQAAGQYRRSDGTFASYNLEQLGLPSRDGYVEAGREGRYDLRVSYDGQPTRLYETGVTPFLGTGGGNLTLPANWVAAGGTSGMSALSADLAPVKIEYDRRTASLLGRYFANPSWTFHAELRRQEKDGTGLIGGSFLTEATQLPRPIDYVTNSIDAGAAWAGRRTSFRLTYTGSWFEDHTDSLTFANPYLPIAAGPIATGSTQGRFALPPDNNLQQIAAAGNVRLPWLATTLSFDASLGSLRQNTSFLPISTLPGAGTPVSGSLDGNVRLTHYALGLAARPLPKLIVRGNASYDGRDDRTAPIAIPYVVTDTFPGGIAVTPRYGEDRARLDGGADYALLRWFKVGVGGKFNSVHYAPGQVLNHAQDTESWGRASITPIAALSFTLKGGNALRKTGSFDAGALPPGENPLVRAYNYAPRDRVFYSLTSAWAATPTLTWTLEGSVANDDYRLSQLGIQSAHERRGSTTVTWAPRESLSAYVDAGYQRLYTLQNGYSGIVTAPWFVTDTERFWNVGAGGRWVVNERWILNLDYVHAPSYVDTNSIAGGVAQSFPQNWTKLDSVRLDLKYRWTPAWQIHFRYVHEQYNSNDWSLEGVGPDTIPNLLTLGLQPYRDSVNLFGLAVRYQFGAARGVSPTTQ